MRRIATCLLSLVCVLPAWAGTWKIDPAHTSVAFSVRHMMVSNVRGTFDTVAGTAQGDPAKPLEATIEVTIEAKSVDTHNEKRDEHLRGPDFFDVAKYPTITFRSTKIEAAGAGAFKVTGDLTLHGTTKPVVVEVTDLTPPIKDPYGNMRAGAHVAAKINRKDFGVAYSKLMDGGGLVVGDEVTIAVDVEATQQP